MKVEINITIDGDQVRYSQNTSPSINMDSVLKITDIATTALHDINAVLDAQERTETSQAQTTDDYVNRFQNNL